MVSNMLTKKLYEEVDLLSRHLRVLKAVMKHQPIGINRLSKILGLEVHEVRNSLSTLENNGFIEATPNGAVIKGDIREKIFSLTNQIMEIRDSLEILRKEFLEIVI